MTDLVECGEADAEKVGARPAAHLEAVERRTCKSGEVGV